MISRRTALIGGFGTLAGVAVARGIDQGLIFPWPRPSLNAWADWNDRRYQGPLALVAAGILAASPHNTQPWRFGVGNNGIDLFEVPERALGAMDPFGRERLAGLGAAAQNMALAATTLGVAASLRLLPDPANPRHIARISLGNEPDPVARPHPLVPEIGRRHTDRGPWRGGPIGAADMAALAAVSPWPEVRVELFDAASPRGRRFGALTIDATAAITGDADMSAASHHWFRHLRRDQERRKDGLSVATSGVSPWLAAAAAMLPEQSAADEGRYWLAGTRDTAVPTASAFGLITVRDPHDRRSAILAGAAWQGLHLAAVARGLAVQPLNQLPEMIDRQRQLGMPPAFARAADALLADPGWRPTFTFRVGRPLAPAKPSLRRPVSDVLGGRARLAFDVEESRRRDARPGFA